MTVTYRVRPYFFAMLAGFIMIPGFSFLHLLSVMSVAHAFRSTFITMIALPALALYCLIYFWDAKYVFTATEVTYFARGKEAWAIPTKDIEVIFSWSTLMIRHGHTKVPMYWMTRKRFATYIRRASELAGN